MAYNALYLAGTCWNNPLTPPQQFVAPGERIRTQAFALWQNRVNIASYGFVGYWWPLFLDYNEAKEADDPSVRNSSVKGAVTLMFREFSYTEDRPGLNGETSGLVKFYMPLDKAEKHLLTDCRLYWEYQSFEGGRFIPFDEDVPMPDDLWFMMENHANRGQFFDPKTGEPYLRPIHTMLRNVPPLPGVSQDGHTGAGSQVVSRITDSTGGVFRPSFKVISPPEWASELDSILEYDPKYNFTFLQQNTRFGRFWPAGLEFMVDRVSREKLLEGLAEVDDRHVDVTFIGYGNNVVGNPWSDLGAVPWAELDMPIPQEFNIADLQERANILAGRGPVQWGLKWQLWQEMITPGGGRGNGFENWADYYTIKMFAAWGDTRSGDEPIQRPFENRQITMSSLESHPVADYVIEGDTIYDWMQWACAMAGGWPDIGQRNRGDMVGERAHWIKSDIGPDTIVQWRGKNWKIAGDDEETRMDNVRWITAPPTDAAPRVRPRRFAGNIQHHASFPETGVGWETLKRWRRLIPPPADGAENIYYGLTRFGYNSVDYGILLADNPVLAPGEFVGGRIGHIEPVDRRQIDQVQRLGGPIPDAIKDPHIGQEPAPRGNNTRWRNAGSYRDFVSEENPEIFFEKFGRQPVWEEIEIPAVKSRWDQGLGPETQNWPDTPIKIFDESSANEQWKINQNLRGKRQIAIPPIFLGGDGTSVRPDRQTLRFRTWIQFNNPEDIGIENLQVYEVFMSFQKSIKPGLPPGPIDGIGWDYNEPGGNLAGIYWGHPNMREIAPTTYTENVQGERVANTQSAIYYSPWEGTPPWYLALTNYSQSWAVIYPVRHPWVANPPLWLMPAPPAYAELLMSDQDILGNRIRGGPAWPSPDAIWGILQPAGLPPIEEAAVGIPGAIASASFLGMLAQGGIRGISLPESMINRLGAYRIPSTTTLLMDR